MFEILSKIKQSLQIYSRYFNEALIEIYFHFLSPLPWLLIMKKWALANRALRVLWAPKSPGRKPLASEIVDLILELKSLNPRWGAQKISHESAKVGISVSKKTVLKYLEIHGLNSPHPRNRLSWSQFLQNHKFKIGIDFTSLISILGKQLFIFVMIDLDSRKLIFINATFNPTAQWVTQQFRNAFLDFDHYPTLCICDNDQIFHDWFSVMLDDYFDMELRKIPYRSPHKNGRTERFHLTLKTEGFHNVVPINLLQTIRTCRLYQHYYNDFRPHQGIDGKIPNPLDFDGQFNGKFSKTTHLNGKIVSLKPNFSQVA